MVIGLLTIAAIPTTIGVAEAISAQKKANNAAKEKAKSAMTAELSIDDEDPVECPVVLREDGRVSDPCQAPSTPPSAHLHPHFPSHRSLFETRVGAEDAVG